MSMELSNPIATLREIFVKTEESKNTYVRPFPSDIKVKRTETGGDSHKGPFKGAEDYLVELGTPILAPLGGRVIEVVDDKEKYGPTEEFKDELNYITIAHSNGEYSQPAHFAKDSITVKVGDLVQTGQQLGISGNSGWMTEPHIHLLVFKLDSSPSGFKGLKIRFKQ